MTPELVRMLSASVVRHGLTALSVYLVQKHMLSADQSADFITDMTNYVVDAIPGIISLVWSMVQKSDTHDELQQGVAISTPLAPPAPAKQQLIAGCYGPPYKK